MPQDLAASPTQAFNGFLDDLEEAVQPRRFLLMIDEFEVIEAKLNQGALDASILSYIRSLMQHRD